ncbi:hypothetical protein [Selenomonas sp. KH1T6]|uniref:hypothetical protein n=1 Tax=Selenomonas sp. KH1T6 TaxID=3158784 RepID=UPI00158713F5
MKDIYEKPSVVTDTDTNKDAAFPIMAPVFVAPLAKISSAKPVWRLPHLQHMGR